MSRIEKHEVAERVDQSTGATLRCSREKDCLAELEADNTSMKQSSAKLLQAAIAVLGIAVFVFLIWEPTVEGRNAHATLFQIYFNDPFLAIAYGASIPFFIALYQAFKLFGEAGRGDGFSPRSLSALRTIRYCALVIIGFISAGEAYLFIVVRGTDDIAGGVGMGIFVAALCAASAIATILFERTLLSRPLA